MVTAEEQLILHHPEVRASDDDLQSSEASDQQQDTSTDQQNEAQGVQQDAPAELQSGTASIQEEATELQMEAGNQQQARRDQEQTADDGDDNSDGVGMEANINMDVDVQDFVAVRVKGTSKKASDQLFVAKVVSKPEGQYGVSYMIKQKNLYTWPAGEEQIFVHPKEDIIAKLDTPKIVMMGSRLLFDVDIKKAELAFHKV